MDKYFADDTTVIPFYIFEADDVTPAPTQDVTWEYVDAESQQSFQVHVDNAQNIVTPSLGPSNFGELNGDYEYVYTTVDTDGFESASSQPSEIGVRHLEEQTFSLDFPDADPGIVHRRIYRRKLPNDVFRFVGEGDDTAFTFTDNTNLDDLTNLRTPPLVYGNTAAKFVGPSGYFSTPGLYLLVGRFELLNGSTRTVQTAFQIVDPLAVAVTEVDKTIDLAWMLFEDCYDSIEGGPHLQDETKAIFDSDKLSFFMEIALFNIGVAPPAQTYTPDSYPYDTGRALLAKGIMLEAIKHLMRSYVEQPLPVNDPTMHLQRRDYLERWRSLYDLEKAEFDQWVILFKRDQYGFGHTAMLVGGQSGLRTPRILRTRYPRFAGGWWGRF